MKKNWEFEIKEETFYIEGKRTPLICGEIHYFRIPRENWERVLDSLVESGCNAVAYYVPWFVHEYEEGIFDFTGEQCPENDLHTWIRLTMERGLLAYFRPGPYVYAETTDLGIPRWFTKIYPDAVVKRYRSGTYEDTDFASCVSHNHPDFLKAVERWYEAICREIQVYQAPAGNIVMFQLCNEIPGDDNDDENPNTHGIGDPEGIWPQYLRETYGNVDCLNQQYGTGFACFSGVRFHELKEADSERYRQDHLAYYYGTYYPLYFQRLKKMAEKGGIHVCLTHNAYNPRAVSLHYQNKKKNPWLTVGLDCYYSLTGRLGIREATYFCEFGAEYGRRFLKNVPWVIEQECGYWHDFPAVYGPELYIFNIWTMACGYQGMNLYLFAGGINRPGMGFFGTEHNWQAPVSFEGKKEDSYGDIKRSICHILENQDSFLEESCYDIGLGISHAPGLIWKPVSKPGSEAYFALKQAGFTPQICDYEAMAVEELLTHPALFVVSDDCMDAEVQENLAAYVERGGHLILNGRIPDRTTQLEPCRILADALGIESQRAPFLEANQQKLILEEREYYIGKNIQQFHSVNGELLAVDRKQNTAAEIIRKGEGAALLLPFAVEVLFKGMADALIRLLAVLEVHPMITGANMLRAVPKKGGKTIFLNLHPVRVTEEIRVKTGQKDRTYSVNMEPHSFKVL